MPPTPPMPLRPPGPGLPPWPCTTALPPLRPALPGAVEGPARPAGRARRLTTRFGANNERIIALKGVYEEALAKDDKELEKIFNDYEKVLKEDPTNFSVRKRRVAVLKSLGRTADAITALTVLLENSPTDAEAWAELSELYASIGAWGQAIFCLEEVLLIMPNAWSVRLPSP